MKLQILIFNNIGEVYDKQFGYDSFDAMRNFDVNQMVNEAEDYAIENNMLEEELKSKEEHEFDKEDDTDEFRENLTEKSDLNNPTNFI